MSLYAGPVDYVVCEHCGEKFVTDTAQRKWRKSLLRGLREPRSIQAESRAARSELCDVRIALVSIHDPVMFFVVSRNEVRGLFDDPCWGVRAAAAANASAPYRLVDGMERDDAFAVRRAMWEREDLSDEAREVLAPEFG